MDWHPILAAVEIAPGSWEMRDGFDEPYALLRLVRRGDELGYHAELCDATAIPIDHVGYYLSLRAAAMAAQRKFIRSHGAPPRTDYGS